MMCCGSSRMKVKRIKTRMGPGRMHGMMHGMMPHMMVMCCTPGGECEEWSTADELKEAEEYQRDLEQEVADLADRIKDLREKVAAEEEEPAD